MMLTQSGRTAEQHVVIAGGGRVGHRTVHVLHDYGHEVYLIERDPETVDAVTGRRTGVVIEGGATDPNILSQAELERAGVLVALTGEDTVDFAICAETHHLADQIRSITRVRGPEHPESATEFVNEFIYPERAASKTVINYVQEDAIRTLEDVTGELDVLDIRVDPRSPVAGKQLKEALFPEGTQIISDADGTEIARPETTLEPGRRYLVAAEPSVADDVHKLLVG